MPRSSLSIVVLIVASIAAVASQPALRAAEPIDAPPPIFQYDGATTVRIFPALLTDPRRYGPVEEPAPEFYAERNAEEPGFPIAPTWPSFGGWGGWGFGGFGFGGGWRGGWSGWGFPAYGVSPVGYNRYGYRGGYSSPYRATYSTRFPWYTPQGSGPNIYQPWYSWNRQRPWYAPTGAGPNLYTPNYLWQSQYPWFSPDGVGPNIYTPAWRGGGGFYW